MTGSITRRPAAAGFSLVELLVVLALIGILALIGMPWMLGTLHRAKLVATAREASTLMQGARLEAIKRSAPTMALKAPAASSSSRTRLRGRGGMLSSFRSRMRAA